MQKSRYWSPGEVANSFLSNIFFLHLSSEFFLLTPSLLTSSSPPVIIILHPSPSKNISGSLPSLHASTRNKQTHRDAHGQNNPSSIGTPRLYSCTLLSKRPASHLARSADCAHSSRLLVHCRHCLLSPPLIRHSQAPPPPCFPSTLYFPTTFPFSCGVKPSTYALS